MTDNSAGNVDLSGLKIDRASKGDRHHSRKRWRHLLWLLLPVILYFGYFRVIEEVTPASKIKTTSVRLLSGQDAAAELVATGYVVAQVKAAVSSKATGRLAVLNVEEGDKVLQGEVIAVLENDDIEASLQLQRANLAAVRADSTLATQNYERQKSLWPSGSTTEDQVQAAAAEYLRANANVTAAEAQVRIARVELENTYVRAPFDGTVLSKHADPGEMVAPFASASSSRGAVVTLADMSSLEVEADVSESNIQKVIVDAPCEIVLDAYPLQRYPGYVKKIVPTADRSRATVMVKIAFNDIDERVLPEMSARVNFLPESTESARSVSESVLVVSRDAITSRDAGRIVFRVVDGQAVQTPVELGRELGEVVEVLSGLQAGDQVVLSPPGGMKAGDKLETSN